MIFHSFSSILFWRPLGDTSGDLLCFSGPRLSRFLAFLVLFFLGLRLFSLVSSGVSTWVSFIPFQSNSQRLLTILLMGDGLISLSLLLGLVLRLPGSSSIVILP